MSRGDMVDGNRSAGQRLTRHGKIEPMIVGLKGAVTSDVGKPGALRRPDRTGDLAWP
jgi:hypothetical protein